MVYVSKRVFTHYAEYFDIYEKHNFTEKNVELKRHRKQDTQRTIY